MFRALNKKFEQYEDQRYFDRLTKGSRLYVSPPCSREGSKGWVPIYRFIIIGYRQNLYVGAKLPARTRRRNKIFSQTIDNPRLLLYNNNVSHLHLKLKFFKMKIKKKDIFIAALIIILLAAIVGGCIFLTRRRQNTDYAPPIQSVDRVHLYLSDEVTLTQAVDVSKYVNGSNYILYPGNTENGIQYFSCYVYDSDKTLFFKYNTINGNLAKIDFETGPNVPFLYASGGFIYYLKLNISNENHYYTNHLCRIPISGGEQILAEYDPGNAMYANLHFVVEKKVILSLTDKILAYDIDKNETLTLFDSEKNGFDMVTADIWYYGGNLYFEAISKTRESNIPTDDDVTDDMIPVNSSYLLTFNMKTKKSRLLLEEPINCYYMTADEIIYMPKVHRTIEIGGKIMPLYNDKIFACDLDGKNSREIFSGLEIWAYSILAIKDEKIYVHDGYAETAKASIKEIDINTGEVGIYRGEETE